VPGGKNGFPKNVWLSAAPVLRPWVEIVLRFPMAETVVILSGEKQVSIQPIASPLLFF
jgi:hypothetical protein